MGGGFAALAGQGVGGRAAAAGRQTLSDGSGGAGQGRAAALSGLGTGPETPYLNATREPPRSAFELNAGSLIPGVMVGGVSSDLPGTLVAQVRRNVYDSQQTAAGAVDQQLGRLGSECARRGLDVAPTLDLRPGYRLTVMVTKDVVLPPWEGCPVARRRTRRRRAWRDPRARSPDRSPKGRDDAGPALGGLPRPAVPALAR